MDATPLRKELEKKLLGTLKSGEMVYDRPRSHLHTNDALEKHLPLALAQIDSKGQEFFCETIDFGTEIGFSNFVEVTPEDEIVYAQRLGRRGPSRFVKNRVPLATSKLTVILKKIETGYIAVTAFLGPKNEPEPWDPFATEHSAKFWETHAVVWGTEIVLPDTETTDTLRFHVKLSKYTPRPQSTGTNLNTETKE